MQLCGSLKLQYFGHLMGRTDSLEKTLMLGRTEGRKKGKTEDQRVGWKYLLNGHKFELTPVVGDGHRGLVCHSPHGVTKSRT